jgi:hypothetical protein
MKFIEQLGVMCMKVMGIEDIKPYKSEETCMTASEDRSFINYDEYDPTRQQRNRSEFDSTADSATIKL